MQVPVGAGPAARPAEPAADTDAAVPLDDDGHLRHPRLRRSPDPRRCGAPRPTTTGSAGWRRAGPRPGSIASSAASSASSDAAPRPSSAAIYTTAAGIEVPHEATYTLLAGGAISVDETVELPDALDDLPRVGTVLELATGPRGPALVRVRAARDVPGPKARRARSARWDSSVGDQYVPYIRPQENGGHADVRWLEVTLTTDESTGIRIELDAPRQVSVTHLRAADLAAATHDIDVVPVAETIVHLDAAHRGLGTASCGPDTLPEYRLGPGTYRWALDPPRPTRGLTDADRLVARDPRAPPPQRADQLRHAGPRQRHARPSPFRGAARPRPLARPPRADRFRRLHEPHRRPGPARIPDDRHRRLPDPGPDRRARPTARPSSISSTASTGSSPANRHGRRATACPRPTSSPTARPTRSKSSSPTPPSGLRVELSYTIFRDAPGHRPQRPDPQRRHEHRSA